MMRHGVGRARCRRGACRLGEVSARAEEVFPYWTATEGFA